MKHLMLALLLIMVISTAVNSTNVIVSWQPNTESDLGGYKVYWGTESRNYNIVMDVGIDTFIVLHDFEDSTMYYFAITAYDTVDGMIANESGYSNEDSTFVVHNKAPRPPVGCTSRQTR